MKKIKTVIVIDDEMLVREITSSSLAKIGFEVLKAKNGEEGLSLCRQRNPDLIFLDYMMSDFTGIEIAVSLRKDPRFAEIPIVMISGKAESTDIQKAKEAGINYYLEKPVTPQKIINFIMGEFPESVPL